MDSDPLPLLLGNQVCDAAVRHPGRPEYQIAVPQEVLQGGCGGCDAYKSARVRTPDPFGSDLADAVPVEGPVDGGHDVIGLVSVELWLFILD